MGVQKQRRAQCPTPRPVAVSPAADTLVRLVGRLSEVIRIEEREVARSGGAQIHVRHAERCEPLRAAHQYRLTLAKQHPHLQLNGDISILRPGREPVAGRVVRTHGRHVWVATEELGEDLTELTLRSEVDWLWAAVRHRLRALWPASGRAQSGAVVPQHALILDLLNARSRKRTNPVSASGGPADLNREQRNAVRKILAQAVTYLWGPPGTGKTTTLAAAVAALVARARTVLVVAPSNAAADVVARQIAQRLSSHPGFDNGLVVRHGSGTGRKLRSHWGDRVVPEDIARRLDRESAYTCGANPQRTADRAASLERALSGLAAGTGLAKCPLLTETGRRVVRSLRLRANAPSSSAPGRTTSDCVTKNALVVVTTAHQLAFESAAAHLYDTVVIDEAGQASLPLVLLAAAHAREAVVVAGDPRQLPPTVQSRDLRVKRLLGEDVFTLSGAISCAASGAACMLVEQHRMAPEISALVSAIWYGDKLRSHVSVFTRQEHPIRRCHGSLLFVDTGALTPRVALTRGNSRINRVHVEAVRQLLVQLEAEKLIPRSTSVLVTSPFKAQTSRLARAINRRSASTVHAAQGGEADLVVLDLTDAPGAEVSRFLSGNGIEDDGGRLLNVAVSRARHAVIVVADFGYLKVHGGEVLREFLREVDEAGKQLEVPVHLLTPGQLATCPPGSGRGRRAR